MRNEQDIEKHKARVLAKIRASLLVHQQQRINYALEFDNITPRKIADCGIIIDNDLLIDLLNIQAGRNAHAIQKSNDI